MSDSNAPMFPVETRIVAQAMQWMEDQWPYDPEAATDKPTPQFEEGELMPPNEVEVRHYDGWRIGWIRLHDGQWTFVRDYKEDA